MVELVEDETTVKPEAKVDPEVVPGWAEPKNRRTKIEPVGLRTAEELEGWRIQLETDQQTMAKQEAWENPDEWPWWRQGIEKPIHKCKIA